MIVYLQGTVHSLASDHLVLLTHGVGYQIFASKSTLAGLLGKKDEVSLHIHSVVREDAHLLFGFAQTLEKEIFLRLIQVSSIGPKIALSVLSSLSPQELISAVQRGDLATLTGISGIGKKTAERMLVDLKDQILKIYSQSEPQGMESKSFLPLNSTESDAISALTGLGYSRGEALEAFRVIPNAAELSLEALVRAGLKVLA